MQKLCSQDPSGKGWTLFLYRYRPSKRN